MAIRVHENPQGPQSRARFIAQPSLSRTASSQRAAIGYASEFFPPRVEESSICNEGKRDDPLVPRRSLRSRVAFGVGWLVVVAASTFRFDAQLVDLEPRTDHPVLLECYRLGVHRGGHLARNVRQKAFVCRWIHSIRCSL